MAVAREQEKCPLCGEPYEAKHKKSDLPRSMQMIGDTFIGWDIEGHQKTCTQKNKDIFKNVMSLEDQERMQNILKNKKG